MGLSRLDNFLKSVRGTILYVDPSSLDSTDSIENQGNSLTRPFKTIQRALVESARFSYQIGLDNDRFDKTPILVYPGEHIIDIILLSIISRMWMFCESLCSKGCIMSCTCLDVCCSNILKTYLELVIFIIQRQVDLMLRHYTLSGMSRLLFDQLYRF